MKYFFLFLPLLWAQPSNAQENRNEYVKLAESYLIQAEQALTSDSIKFKAYLDSAFKVSNKYKLSKIKSKAIITNGVYHFNRGEYTSSLQLYLEALELVRSKNYPDLEAKIYDNIGLVHYSMQNYDKAVDNSLKALKINQKLKDSVTLVRNHNNLGINYYMLKKFESAIFHYTQSKKLSEAFDDTRGVITSISNIALVKSELNNYDGALKDYLLALKYARNTDDPLTTAYVLLNVGSTHTLSENPDEGIKALKEAQMIADENGFVDVKKYCHQYLEEAYEAKGDFESSLEERRLFDQLKDSLQSLEKEKGIIEIETRYDTKTKEEKIEEQGSIISSYLKSNRILFISVVVILLVFGFFIFRFIKSQKRIKREKAYIDENYRAVNQENQELKHRLLEVSAKLNADRDSKSNFIKYKRSSLSSQQRELYVEQLLNYMQLKKPYINPEITPQEIASDLQMSKHHLSEILSINLGKNFYGFMNLYRVENAKELILNDTANMTLIAVAFDSGFNSKTSFNRAFKEITGITPSEFRLKNKKSELIS